MTALPRIILPWTKTSDLSANSRLHWRKRHALVKAQKRAADALAREAGWHKAAIHPDAKMILRLIYCPPSNVSTVDDDNIITAHKGARDAFAAVLGINDSQFTTVAERGEKCRFGAVIVQAETIPPENEASRQGCNPSGSDHNPELGETGMAFEKHITGKAGDQ